MQHKISNSLILSSSFIDNIGLLNGKMGIAIYFFHLSRFTKDDIYHKYAEELIEEISDEVTLNTPMDFENGLSGIGWGIKYLIEKKYLEGDSNIILEELDSEIVDNVINNSGRIDSKEEIIGYGIYFLSRLKNNKVSSKNKDIIDLEKGLSSIIIQMESMVNEIIKYEEYFKSFKNIPEYCLLLYFLFELKKSRYKTSNTNEFIKCMLNKLLKDAFSMDCEILKVIIYTAKEYFNLKELDIQLSMYSSNKSLDIMSYINKDLLIAEVDNDVENKRIKSLLLGLLYFVIYSKSNNKEEVLFELTNWTNYSSNVSSEFISNVNFKSDTNDLGIKRGLAGFGLVRLFFDEIIAQNRDITLLSNL